jgi:hypothetical protein
MSLQRRPMQEEGSRGSSPQLQGRGATKLGVQLELSNYAMGGNAWALLPPLACDFGSQRMSALRNFRPELLENTPELPASGPGGSFLVARL